MFTESLLDYSAGRAQRSWSTFIAWLCQTCLIALAILLPLWQTNALPRVIGVLTPIGAPPGAAAPKPAQPVHNPEHVRATRMVVSDGLQSPIRVPRHIDTTPDRKRETEVAEVPCTYCVPGGIPGQQSPGPGILRNIIPQPTETAPPPLKPPSRVIVSGGVQQGFLIHQVQPSYPAIARAARVEGTVVLAAVINRDGTIQGLHALSGPPMLIGAAIDAVRQWRYRPYMLSNQPVEVETQISVIFTLSH